VDEGLEGPALIVEDLHPAGDVGVAEVINASYRVDRDGVPGLGRI